MTNLMKPLTAAALVAVLAGCQATPPSKLETKVAEEAKELVIGGKDLQNPVTDDAKAVKTGGEHFQHHCQICHGLDGQNTGVPFAEKMSPPVANLAMPDIQKYADGQLKWIIENGIRMTGMPGWKGILDDDEMWRIILYIRHLPAKGSLGAPAVFVEESKAHSHAKGEQHKHEHKH